MRRPARLYRLHKHVPYHTLQDGAASIQHVDSSGNKRPGMGYAAFLTLTARLTVTIARILANDFADMPDNPNRGDAVFESCERQLISWSIAFSETFPGAGQKQERLNCETGPFLVVSLIIHDASINALYLPRVLQARQAHRESAPKVRQYSETMRRAAVRTAVFINEALESKWADSIPTQL